MRTWPRVDRFTNRDGLHLERTQLLRQVADLLPTAKDEDCVLVGVHGSGKTAFAAELADALQIMGRRVVRISVDDFHNASAFRHRRGRSSPEGFWLDWVNYERLRDDVLEPLGPGGSRPIARWRRTWLAIWSSTRRTPSLPPVRSLSSKGCSCTAKSWWARVGPLDISRRVVRGDSEADGHGRRHDSRSPTRQHASLRRGTKALLPQSAAHTSELASSSTALCSMPRAWSEFGS